MFKIAFIGWALVLFGYVPTGDQITQNGFEEPDMYISTDRPPAIAWSISSTPNGDAAFVTSPNYLTDGKVAIPARFTFDTGNAGGPLVDSTVSISTAISFTVPEGGSVAFVAFCPKTPYALPAGLPIVSLTMEDASTNILGNTAVTTTLLDDGSVIAIAVVTNPYSHDFVATSFTLELINYHASPWASPGQTIDIGEVWFGNLSEFQSTTDPKWALVDPTLNRRAHSNMDWPLFIKPYTQWTFNFAPMDNTDAYDSSSTPSFASVRYAISQARCALVLPRIYVQGTTTIDDVALNQLACFGKPESVGELAMVKDSGALWTAQMVFGQQPP